MNTKYYSIIELQKLVKLTEKATKNFLLNIKKRKPLTLDSTIAQLHEEVFSEINCLECANCCRSLGPRVSDHDIQKISKALKMRPAIFTETYLKIDEDKDYIFKTMPCPFLMPDNYCSIYNNRPKACKEYPHTDQRNFHQAINVSLKNIKICPAVYEIVERLKTKKF